jgi:hypothetical protein
VLAAARYLEVDYEAVVDDLEGEAFDWVSRLVC